MGDFGNGFYASVDSIQGSFVAEGAAGASRSSSVDLAIGSGIGLIFGGGITSGAFVGYREGGAKGAVVGGAVGLGTVVGVGLIGAALSLPALPLLIAASGLGAVLGKATVQRFFGKGSKADPEAFRSKLKGQLKEQLHAMAEQSDLKEKIRQMIEQAFEAMKNSVGQETETVLKGMESTLEAVKSSGLKQQALTEKEKAVMDREIEKIQAIESRALGMNKTLKSILER
ncbi:MAG: hypothetical protein QM296_08310 [Bacillota bacterium]|nr:hypothetical protein [Bacillota bacterium]